MKFLLSHLTTMMLFALAACTPRADDFTSLSDRVAGLNIHRNDYILGKALTDKQKKTAERFALKASSPGTYKFKDHDLHVVADRSSDRVLVIYERYEPATREKIRELVGGLIFDFGEPTVMAHEKAIYWAFDAKGKISGGRYRKTKKEGRPLKTLATVKLDSSHKIMNKSTQVGNGHVYYIISSEPILKIHQKENS